MNILYLHQHFTLRSGSAGTRSYEFARLLQQKGHQITILCGWADGSGLPISTRRIHRWEHDGLTIVQLGVPYRQVMPFWRRIWAFIAFMLLASWVAMRERRSDVILATSTPLTIAVPAMIAALLRRRPFVFEARDLWPDVPIGLGALRNRWVILLARGLERLTYRRAAHIITASPGMQQGIVARGVNPVKITVIPNSCDLDLFDVPAARGEAFIAAHPQLKDRRLVVYTGALGLVNGLDYLVKVAHHARDLDAQIGFLLVGKGREKDGLIALAQELGVLDHNVWFMDPVPRQEVPDVLSACTVATSTVQDNPVLWHNSANKFFDALAAGRPMVINHEGWLADLLRESGAGLVLPVRDPVLGARLLVEFIQSEDRLEMARRSARDLARTRFDRKRLVDQLERVLLETRK